MGFFTFSNQFPVDGRTVLITGGSQGMGRGVAKLLAKKGASIVIVARGVEKLKAANEYIGSAATDSEQRFHYISADLKDPAECKRVVDEVTIWNNGNPPDIVWTLTGGTYPSLLVEMTPERIHEQMDTNFWTQANLAYAVMKVWTQPASPSSPSSRTPKPPPRHLVFTSSVLAFYPMCGYAQYAPAKAALRALSDALRQESILYNGANANTSVPDIKVHTVFPGTIFTPGFEEEQKTKPAITKKLEEGDKGHTEDEVSAISIRGLEKGEYMICVSLLGQLIRGCAWGSSPRNNWLWDYFINSLATLVWAFLLPDTDKTVFKWGKENGHPSTYKKE